MKKLYCVNCGKYRKFEKPNEKALVLSIMRSKYKWRWKFLKKKKKLNIKNSWFNWKFIVTVKIW